MLFSNFSFRICDEHVKEKASADGKKGEDNYWIKDLLVEYANLFPQVASLLYENRPDNIYTIQPFKGYRFREMLELYKQHQQFSEDSHSGLDGDREKAAAAYKSVRCWLNMEPEDIKAWALKDFRQYILDSTAVDPVPAKPSPVHATPSPVHATPSPIPATPSPVPVVPAEPNADHAKPSSDHPPEPDFETWEEDLQDEILKSMDKGNHIYSSFCTV